jgi:hypothetical protein
MPRVYAPESPATQRKNAAKKYRAHTQGTSQHLAEREGSTPHDTLPTHSALSPSDVVARLLIADDSAPHDDSFTTRQVALLMAYVAFPTDPVAGALTICQSVGYDLYSLDQAQCLLRAVLDRVTALDDMRRAMRLSGVGEMWWVRRIFHLAQCGSPRVEVQAMKLAGLAMGAFDDPIPSAGATIIIEQAETTPTGGRKATRTTIAGVGEATLEGTGQLTFPATKPQKRRKILNNLAT